MHMRKSIGTGDTRLLSLSKKMISPDSSSFWCFKIHGQCMNLQPGVKFNKSAPKVQVDL